jgi:hypothetical protein
LVEQTEKNGLNKEISRPRRTPGPIRLLNLRG